MNEEVKAHARISSQSMKLRLKAAACDLNSTRFIDENRVRHPTDDQQLTQAPEFTCSNVGKGDTSCRRIEIQSRNKESKVIHTAVRFSSDELSLFLCPSPSFLVR